MAYKAIKGLADFKERLVGGRYSDVSGAKKSVGLLKEKKSLKPAEAEEALRLVEAHFASNPPPPPKQKATKGKKIPSVATAPTIPPELPPRVLPLTEVDIPQLTQDGLNQQQFHRVRELILMNNELLDGMLKAKAANPSLDVSDVATISANIEKLTRLVEKYQDYALPIMMNGIPKARTPVNAGVQQQPIPTKEAQAEAAVASGVAVQGGTPSTIPAAFMKPPTESQRRAFASTIPPSKN